MTHPAPGHELDAVVLRAQLAEIALILRERAPVGAWCQGGGGCQCYACAIRRIIRWAP